MELSSLSSGKTRLLVGQIFRNEIEFAMNIYTENRLTKIGMYCDMLNRKGGNCSPVVE